ncbi:MAG: DUF805 domain-containing protein [Pseudomonadota bacterium]
MNIAHVLFSPNGRIPPKVFWRGVIILVGALVVIQVLSNYGPPFIAMMLGLLSLAMPYFYLCVYGKRLHDAGATAWWYVAFFIGYLLGTMLLGAILGPILSPGMAAIQEEAQYVLQSGDFQGFFALTQEAAREGLMSTLVALFLINGGLGYLAARLPSDPQTNEHGPPTLSDGPAETFQ